jgi:hypothetical protein
MRRVLRTDLVGIHGHDRDVVMLPLDFPWHANAPLAFMSRCRWLVKSAWSARSWRPEDDSRYPSARVQRPLAPCMRDPVRSRQFAQLLRV